MIAPSPRRSSTPRTGRPAPASPRRSSGSPPSSSGRSCGSVPRDLRAAPTPVWKRPRDRRRDPSSSRAGSRRRRATPARSRRRRRAMPGARRFFLRCSPTRLVSQTNSGSSASANAARRQSSSTIATTVASTVVTFESTEVAVDVTTVSIPPMSFAIRLCTSPVRPREEGQGEALEMAVDRGAQVVHHRLADEVREERLPDAEDCRSRWGSRPFLRPARPAGSCPPWPGRRGRSGSPCRGRREAGRVG